MEVNETRGFCVMTLSNEDFYVDDNTPYDNKNWQQLKATSIIIPGKYYADLKAALLKYCKERGNCPQYVEERLNAFELIIKQNQDRLKK